MSEEDVDYIGWALVDAEGNCAPRIDDGGTVEVSYRFSAPSVVVGLVFPWGKWTAQWTEYDGSLVYLPLDNGNPGGARLKIEPIDVVAGQRVSVLVTNRNGRRAPVSFLLVGLRRSAAESTSGADDVVAEDRGPTTEDFS